MSSNIIQVPAASPHAGFTKGQFRKLDQLYCFAVANKLMATRTVECDFDEGVASYTYYVAAHNPPYLQFVIRKVGPRVNMYELYKQGKGRIVKSGLFERTFEALQEEIDALDV